MFVISTSSEFNSAHFLKDYEGRCANIHGHKWEVIIEIESEEIQQEGQCRGMIVDFNQLKGDLFEETNRLDHTLIIEKGSLKEATMAAMKDAGFVITELDFRPTAENLAKYFFDIMSTKGYNVRKVGVYETPKNQAIYEK